ncbi:hypothetical protein N0V84_007343 [Fusarium piperis]|uniref:Uncharacterized protein n=1 Tax=Fusarium piperis TaxID=1435070 RepID=A0A9W8WAB6_9HYPO|nr:hypothetical protein N0V84_007343 [Fusarium piperis]
MSDDMDPNDTSKPHGFTPPPPKPSPPPKPPSPETFSGLDDAEDTALDETPDVGASPPDNEPKPLSSEPPPDLPNVEDLPDATTAPDNPISKDGGPVSVPSPHGANDSERPARDESDDVDDATEIDRALVPQPQGLVPRNSPFDPDPWACAMKKFLSNSQTRANGEGGGNTFIMAGGNINLIQNTGPPNQPARDPPQPARDPPRPAGDPPRPANDHPQPARDPPQPSADIPADKPTSPKTSSTSASSGQRETKPAAGIDKGEMFRSFIRGTMLPFRCMYGVLLHKFVIMSIAIIFSVFVLLPIVITLGIYMLSHAPSYVSNCVLGQGYEYGNPLGLSYPTWMPSWGSSQNDTVPEVHVVEDTQEPPPLKFQRPIPQAETDVLPEAIQGYKERLEGTNHEHKKELLDHLDELKKRAQDQKEFNQHFIDDIETRSIVQYRSLQALVANVDLILGELSGTVPRGRAAEGGDKWRWLDSRATARQKTLQRHYDWLKRITDDMDEGRSTEQEAIKDMKKRRRDTSVRMHNVCHAKDSLHGSKDAKTRDLKSGLNIVCSSNRRTTERWDQVSKAIEKERNAKAFDYLANHSRALEDAYVNIKWFAMTLMRELEEFARLDEGGEQ